MSTGSRVHERRRPLACVSCSKSKVRCDRVFPCARCTKRGIQCQQETPSSRRRQRQIREKSSEVSFLDALAGLVSTARAVERVAIEELIQTRKSQLVLDERDEPMEMENQSGGHHDTGAPHAVNASASSAATTRPETTSRVPDEMEDHVVYPRMESVLQSDSHSNLTNSLGFPDPATVVEGLAWGRHQCNKYPHTNCLNSRAKVLLLRDLHRMAIFDDLPSLQICQELIDFHATYLAWYHNVLHMPTFIAQCEEFWENGSFPHPQWLGLYRVVLSVSAWSILNWKEKRGNFHDLPDDLPSTLFESALQALWDGRFMSVHTIYSIQAICISGMVANVLDSSDLLHTLCNTAIRIAQCLGLHRIAFADSTCSRSVSLEREIGRRVWWKLIEMDCYSMPYTGTCSISLDHASTQRPKNCSDDDSTVADDSRLTTSTYSILMTRIALLIPDLLKGTGLPHEHPAEYGRVLEIDRQMRKLVSTIPTAMFRGTLGENLTPWLEVARRTLAISAADKIIMIHRAFLLQSFRSPILRFTKDTCVSAAMTILREHDNILRLGSGCPILWTHSAFCVTAVVVLCLNLFYCRETQPAMTSTHQRSLVTDARSRLYAQRSDSMARRGVLLIDIMLAETDRAWEQQHVPEDPDFLEIIRSFYEKDGNNQAVYTAADELDTMPNEDVQLGQLEDFGVWFANVFGE